jgi:hypothetical protein
MSDVAAQNVYEHYDVDSPAELLVAMRSEPNSDADTPSVVVYVWRGPELPEVRDLDPDPAVEQLSNLGYIHAVKVEVRAPKRCNRACGTDRWPWIETKTSGFMKSKRCFYLRAYEGYVKARVIRYDEPLGNTSRVFRFANNVPFWGMNTSHPDSGGGDPGGIFDDGDAASGIEPSPCYKQIDPMLAKTGEWLNSLGGDAPENVHHAFMLNRRPYEVGDDDYNTCWGQVHESLQDGVHSESCAKYRWEQGDMGMRFMPCDEPFLSGLN